MVRVCVVGGGTAGSAAAAEASERGAEVTVIEKNGTPDPPWRAWPSLVRPFWADVEPRREAPKSAKVLAAEARACRAGAVSTTAGEVRCDALILATGSSFEPPAFGGSRKAGVFVLDSPHAYQELGSESDSVERVVLAGEGGRCLEVAERLSGGGRRIQIFVSHWQLGPPSPSVFEVIAGAAADAGVSIAPGKLAQAVGTGRVEAAVVDGTALPSDKQVSVPRRVPRVPVVSAPVGRRGGVLVRRTLSCAAPGTFAAGGCAEVEGEGLSCTLECEPSSSGRLAASNSMGEGVPLGDTRISESLVFGMRWVRLGRRWAPGRPGSRSDAICQRWGGYAACEITLDPSGGAAGIEFVVGVGSQAFGGVPVRLGTDLSSLAYGGTGSTDISLISETARLGLKRWQGS